MEKLKKLWVYIVVVMSIFLLFLSFSIAFFSITVNKNKERATLILKVCEDNIKLNFLDHFNYSNLLTLDAASPDVFLKSAEKIMQNPACVYVQYAEKNVIKYAYPTEGYWQSDINKNINQLNYAYNLARIKNQFVVEGPIMQGDQKVFLTILPYVKESDSSKAKDGNVLLGEAIVVLKSDYVLKALNLEKIKNYGFEYDLWQTDSVGKINNIQTSSSGVDFSDSVGTEFKFPNIWNLDIIPTRGWISAISIVTLLLATIIVTICSAFAAYFFYRTTTLNFAARIASKFDTETGFIKRDALQQELKKLTAIPSQPFALFYIVYNDYIKLTQLCDANQNKLLVEHIKNCFNNYVKNEHITARIAENVFVLIIKDNLSLENLQNLKKDLYIELMHKMLIDGKKELISANMSLTLFPADATDSDLLLAKATSNFFNYPDSLLQSK